MNKAEIRKDLNTATLYIDGEKRIPVLYSLSDFPGAKSNTAQGQRNIKNFAKRGIKLVHCDVCLHHGWRKSTPFDIEPILAELTGVLESEPNAEILLRMHVNPPYWWLRDNPEELILYRGPSGDHEGLDNGEQLRLIQDDGREHLRASFASEKWRKEAGEKLAECCQKLSKTPQGKHVFGVQVAYGVYGEWHNFGTDCGSSMQAYFREILREKYKTEEALQKAWNDPSVSFDTAEFHPEIWQKPTFGYMRDPQKEMRILDSQYSMQRAMIGAILHFCKIVKDNWEGVLTGSFYCYYGGAIWNGAQHDGHLMEDIAYAHPELIDFVCSPFPYLKNRQTDSVPLQRGLLESNRLHGVLHLTEMDKEPLGTEYMIDGDPKKHRESVAMLRRNVLQPLMSGMGLWYYDHRIVAKIPEDSKNIYAENLYIKHGWWENPKMLDEIRAMQKIAEKYCVKRYEPAADVLIVCDTKSVFYCTKFYFNEYKIFEAFGRSGGVADYAYLSDLSQAEMDRYRVVVFLNSYLLTDEKRAEIECLTKDKQVVWLYAAGLVDEKGISIENLQKTVGMQVERCAPHDGAEIAHPRLKGEKLVCDLPSLDPSFAICDKQVEQIAFNEKGQCVAARKGNVWYFAYPTLNAEIAKWILQEGGAHIYSDTQEPVLAGAGLVLFHSVQGGKREITLKTGKKVKLSLGEHSAVLLDAKTGKILLK